MQIKISFAAATLQIFGLVLPRPVKKLASPSTPVEKLYFTLSVSQWSNLTKSPIFQYIGLHNLITQSWANWIPIVINDMNHECSTLE